MCLVAAGELQDSAAQQELVVAGGPEGGQFLLAVHCGATYQAILQLGVAEEDRAVLAALLAAADGPLLLRSVLPITLPGLVYCREQLSMEVRGAAGDQLATIAVTVVDPIRVQHIASRVTQC